MKIDRILVRNGGNDDEKTSRGEGGRVFVWIKCIYLSSGKEGVLEMRII